MLKLPTHTPYDGSTKPFTIGLKSLDAARWLETHADLPFLLAEKKRLDALGRDAVFAEEPDTAEAQGEVLELVLAHLLERHGGSYRRVAEGIAVAGLAEPINVADESLPPLLRAAWLVADDLLLMRRGEEGWRLAAASLSFPSSWSLGEKFGRPIHAIHAPVPGFGPGTRNAAVIARIFDHLAPDSPVERWNWSVQGDRRLFLPASHRERGASDGPRFPSNDPVAAAFIRVERQTLRRLAGSGDILFTVRIHLDPLALLVEHPERPRLAGSLAAQLRALTAEEVRYKGLRGDRDRLADALDALARAAPS